MARACRTTMAEGLVRAYETDAVGRSILKHSNSIEDLLEVAKILENIKSLSRFARRATHSGSRCAGL